MQKKIRFIYGIILGSVLTLLVEYTFIPLLKKQTVENNLKKEVLNYCLLKLSDVASDVNNLSKNNKELSERYKNTNKILLHTELSIPKSIFELYNIFTKE